MTFLVAMFGVIVAAGIGFLSARQVRVASYEARLRRPVLRPFLGIPQ